MAAEAPPKFEDKMENLEGIVGKLEGTEVPLDESLALFETGIALVRDLHAELDRVEKRLEVLTRNQEGELEARAENGDEDFDAR